MTTTVSGSLRCAAVHSAWIEYIAEPSPIRQTVLTPGRPSAMPTAAGRPKPRPPLAMVQKLSCPRIGMNFCIAGRCDGASSTSTASSGMADESACSRYSTGIGSPAFGGGGNTRPAGIARLVSGSSSSSIASAGFMVATMLVPNGVTAAASESSVIWKIVVRAVEDRGMAFDVEGEHRRADHDHQIVVAQRIRQLPRRGMQEACELRMPFRKTAARRKRADPDRRSCLLRHAHHQVDGFGAIDAGTDDEGRALAGRERGDERLHRLGIGTEFAADAAGLDRLGWMGPVVDRHRNERRAAGRLHRDVIGARDRGGHIFGARRLDRIFDIGARKFRGALGIEKGLQRQNAARLLARRDHQRSLVAVGGKDIAERIADAGGRMQIDKAGVAGGLRIAVGHADHGSFLQAQHVVDIVRPVGEKRQFGRAGIAEHFFDAERSQQVERGVLDGD